MHTFIAQWYTFTSISFNVFIFPDYLGTNCDQALHPVAFDVRIIDHFFINTFTALIVRRCKVSITRINIEYIKDMYTVLFCIVLFGWLSSHLWIPMIQLLMMTSSNGNIFRVTGPLCGEFTGPRWIPRTKASDAELWCFLWSASEYTVEKIIVRLVIWDAFAPIMTSQ